MRLNFVFFFFIFCACSPQLQVNNYSHNKLRLGSDTLITGNQQVQNIINPYKNILDSQMNVRIGIAGADFKKDNPEGTLGNLVCDLLMEYAKQENLVADFCLLNNGGLRIPTLYKGDISVRTIYELMPFENTLVLVKVKGEKCAALLQMVAENNGVPCAGLRMKIVENSAQDVFIQNKPFDPSKDYWILTSDYIANGGDKADALKEPLERKNFQQLLRDILISQMKKKFYDGETLLPVKDGRITKN